MPPYFEWAAFVFALITIPFYMLILFILHKEIRGSSKRNKSFYLICLIVGYVDVLALLNTCLLYYPPRWSWAESFYIQNATLLLKVCFFISWASGLAQLHSTMLLAFNRFTALAYSHKHDSIWKHRTKTTLAIMLIPALLLGSATFFSSVEYSRDFEGVLVQKLSSKEVSKVLYGISGTLLVVYTAVIFIVYGIIFHTLSKCQPRQIGAPSNAFVNRVAIHKRRELKLLIMTTLVCMIQITITCYIALKFVMGQAFDEKLDIYNVLVVFYSGLNPYLLISFSEVLRERTVGYILWFFCSVPRPVTPTTKVVQAIMIYPQFKV